MEVGYRPSGGEACRKPPRTGDNSRLVVLQYTVTVCGSGSKLLFPEPILLPVNYSDIRVIAILAEAILVLWLVFGKTGQVLRVVIGCCFLGFAMYSLWSWIAGARTCACFGSAARVPPWLMVIVDSFVAAMALRYHYIAVPYSHDMSACSSVAVRRLVLGTALAVCAGSLIYGTPSAFAGSLAGKVLTNSQPYVAVGIVPLNATREVMFEFTNLTAEPVQIVGVRKSCGCVVLEELPLTVAPLGMHRFSVALKTHSFRSSGLLDTHFELLLDQPSYPIHLRISAFVDATRTESPNLVASEGGQQ